MYGTYTAVFSDVAVTVAQDFFELLCPTDAVIEILECRIGQSSDPGDAQAEMLRVEMVRGIGATSGSGGSSATARPHATGTGSTGSTVEINNTTRMVAGGGSIQTVLRDVFNAQVGWLYQPIPEARFWLSPSERMTVALPNAPTDSLTMSGSITWREYGG